MWHLPLPPHQESLVGQLRRRAGRGARMILSPHQTGMLVEAMDMLAEAAMAKTWRGRRYARKMARANRRYLRAMAKAMKATKGKA